MIRRNVPCFSSWCHFGLPFIVYLKKHENGSSSWSLVPKDATFQISFQEDYGWALPWCTCYQTGAKFVMSLTICVAVHGLFVDGCWIPPTSFTSFIQLILISFNRLMILWLDICCFNWIGYLLVGLLRAFLVKKDGIRFLFLFLDFALSTNCIPEPGNMSS